MFDRGFLPPLHASAAVDGSVASRPASRLFTETRAGQILEPLVKPPGGSEPVLGSETEGAPPEGGDGRRSHDPAAQGDAGAASSETAAAEAAAQGDAGAASSEIIGPDDGLVDAGLPDETDGAPAATPGAEEAVDLRGYGAYGNTPVPGLNLSRDELVTRYAHLVKYVVGRLGVSVPGLFDHEDAMQAGVLGLLRAIDAYRPEAAASFESYAILRIRGAILDAVRSLDTVGRAGREAARAIQGAIRDLQHELGRSPTESEIAARLGMPVGRYRERLQAASVVTVSLDEHDARDGDEESSMLADNAPDPNAVDPADEAARRDSIASLIQEIGRLGQRSRMVLALYYQDEMTFKEIGQVLGVTESRVCQIHTEAILALRGRLVDADVAARLGRRRARP
jgi:RNA polymerase sigma factor for flagellar operon FliA